MRTRLYPTPSLTENGEISIRDEFLKTLFGSGQEIAKGEEGLLRRFRLDASEKLIPCSCISAVTGEPDKDTQCPICLGEGNLWDEEKITFYKVELGGDPTLAQQEQLRQHSLVKTPMMVFYIPSTLILTGQDKIVLLKLDSEGEPLLPLARKNIFRISSLRDLRLDTARLEFWKANCYEDTNKFL